MWKDAWEQMSRDLLGVHKAGADPLRDGEEATRPARIDIVSGKDLDQLARMGGVERWEGESDSDFRRRTKAWVTKLRALDEETKGRLEPGGLDYRLAASKK